MRKQNVVLSSLIALYLISGVTFSSSADDVYVDLSVLSALRGSEEFVADGAPLFPDVKNAPEKKQKKKVRNPKKTVAKKTVAPKVKTGVQVAPVEPQIPAPVVEVKKENLPEPVVSEPDLSSESAQVDSLPVQENLFDEVKKQSENAVSSEPVEMQEKQEENNIPQTIIPQEPTQTEVTVMPEPQQETEAEPMETPELLVSQPVPVPTAEAENNEDDETSVQNSVEPLVSMPQALAETAGKNNQISFAEGSDELSDEHKRQLDAIVAGFSDPSANMIAINSYNYDDGTDVFNKKRLSLRRIVAVRSYLLNLGYKNFMPKVINLTDDISKSNIVELEEIK